MFNPKQILYRLSNLIFRQTITVIMKLKRLVILGLAILVNNILLVGCKTQDVFKDVGNILTYKNEKIYHGDDVVAELSSIELAYDDGKLVHEATFVLTDAGENDHALEILKIMHEIKPEWDVEVELQR